MAETSHEIVAEPRSCLEIDEWISLKWTVHVFEQTLFTTKVGVHALWLSMMLREAHESPQA
jgi:hypothetical protein